MFRARALPKDDERGAPATLVVIILAPIFLSLFILAFSASTASRADQTVFIAAQNAVRAAVSCCDSPVQAAFVAENVVRSTLQNNDIACSNLNDPDDRLLVEVRFYADSGQQVLGAPIVSVEVPSRNDAGVSRLLEAATSLEPQDSLPLEPGSFVRVVVACELPLQNLVGFWLPVRNATTRRGFATAVVDPLTSRGISALPDNGVGGS